MGACCRCPDIERDVGSSLQDSCHSTSGYQCSLLLSQDLYAKKWDECTCMSDHIRSSLSLCHQIIKAGQKIEDTHIVYVILLSVPHTGIWDLIKQNHLDKRKGLTLDMVTAELIAIHDRAEWNQVTDKA